MHNIVSLIDFAAKQREKPDRLSFMSVMSILRISMNHHVARLINPITNEVILDILACNLVAALI